MNGRRDPSTSADPRVRAIVEGLRKADYAPAPDPEFRAELRAQLVAVAPRIIAESPAEPAAESRGVATHARRRRRSIRRPLAIAAGVAAAFLMLFGGAVWMSHKALPGDALYGLKRASENVQLSFTSGNTDRGHRYLVLAQTRVQEAQALLRRSSSSASGNRVSADGTPSASTARLIAANLKSADSDLRHGSSLLNTQAVNAKSASPLAIMTGWAPGQLSRLSELSSSLPTGSLQDRIKVSWTLTNSALSRAKALAPAVAAGCRSAAGPDGLGPVCSTSSVPGAPVHSGSGTASTAPGHVTTPATTGNSGATHRSGGTTSTGPTSTGQSGTAGTPKNPSRSATLPTLPHLLPTAPPISVKSCGISVVVGPISGGLSACPSHT